MLGGKMPLNDMICRNAKARAKTYILSDHGGMYLEVRTKGKPFWRLKYRIVGKEKRLYLGAYPETSLAEARMKREEAKQLIKEGFDPGLAKQEEKKFAYLKANQTFELVAKEWHERYKENWSKGHADNILHRLESDVFPAIGHYPIDQIKPPLLLKCIEKIENRKAYEMAKRALQMCGQVFRYAVITGRIERDFTIDMRGALKRKVNKGHYASIEVDELPAFIKKLNSKDVRLFPQTLISIRLLMLTFVRTRELTEVTWPEINLEKAEWIIPGERMKMRQTHIVPLSKQAVQLFKELQVLNGTDGYVFPSIINWKKPMSNNTILKALDNMGYNKKMTGHGFRALAMSAIKEKLGYQHDVVDRQLAHLPKSKVDRAYDRAKFLPQRKHMMQEWADYIDSLT